MEQTGGEKPFIDIREGNYISRIWLFGKRGATFDVLMVLRRELPNGDWELAYRFRYYRDGEAFDSADEKSFWTATFPQKFDVSGAIRAVSPVLSKLRAMTGFDVEVLIVESDRPKVVIDRMSRSKSVHMKRVPREAR